MSTARQSHTATLLLNGNVLVAGGVNKTNFVASAELYDPSTGLWTTTNSLNTAREAHTATLLPDGKVLVAGGYNYYAGGPIASAELYDSSTGTWTTSAMATPRANHTATLLPNGKVLVTGGVYDNNSHATNSAELYNPTNGTWAAAAPMSTARESHTATLLPNGKVLVDGGDYYSGGSVYLSSSELFDPVSGTWAPTGPLQAARTQHAAALLANGKVLAAGGWGNSGITSSAELYDPAGGVWASLSSHMTVARYNHAALLLPNGKVLVAGGLNSVSTAELYDPSSATWAATGSMNHGRYFYTATLLPSGRALLAGGDDNTGYFSALYAAELYVPAPVALPPPWFNTNTANLGLTTNGLKLQVDGIIATNSVVIYASTNLLNWLPILTNGPATGSVSFLDAAATNWPRRFYRAAER